MKVEEWSTWHWPGFIYSQLNSHHALSPFVYSLPQQPPCTVTVHCHPPSTSSCNSYQALSHSSYLKCQKRSPPKWKEHFLGQDIWRVAWTRAFLQPSAMHSHSLGDTHQPPLVPPFLLANLSNLCQLIKWGQISITSKSSFVAKGLANNL